MAIVPAGTMRVMVAQTIANPLVQGYQDHPQEQPAQSVPDVPQEINETPQEGAESVVDPEAEDNNPELQSQPDKMGNPVAEPNDNKESATLTDFVFKKLEEFGYPPRRLEEFKKKFVRESVTPDGIKDLKIEIPDRYYPDAQGNIKTVETEELAKIVKEIGSKFGLNFNGAERSDGKWTINLTSAKKTSSEEEQGLSRDNLDEVYGTPSGGGSKKQTAKKEKPAVRAFTIGEMIKAGKDGLVDISRKILENKNAS